MQDRLDPRTIRDALRHAAAGMSAAEIAATLSVEESRIADCLRRAASADLKWPLPETVSNAALELRLYSDIDGARRNIGAGNASRLPAIPPADASAAEVARSVRNRTIMVYVGIALAILGPGLLLSRFTDLSTLQRMMLDVSFGRGARFWLGVTGTLMTATLLLYPLRKAFPRYFGSSSVGRWFHLHVILGILGPILILYHANFKFSVRDFNANIALLTVLLVVASGFIGQFIYTRASLDSAGQKRAVRQRLDDLIGELKAVGASESETAAIIDRLKAFERDVPSTRTGLKESIARYFHFATHHRQLYREATALLADAHRRYSWPAQEYQRLRSLIGAHLWSSITTARRAAAGSIVEKLWSHWRLLHLPVFLVMVIATSLHIWSVWDQTAFGGARLAAPAAVKPAGQPTALYTPEQAMAALQKWDATTRSLTTGQAFFANSSYAGSLSCQGCHQEQYREWANTWHAKMYRTVNEPSAKGVDNIVVGAFDGVPIPFEKVAAATEGGATGKGVSYQVIPATKHPVTGEAGYFFTVRDPTTPADDQTFKVAIVIGGNLEQMYHVKVGNQHFPAPLRWKVGPPELAAWQVDGTPQPQNWIFDRGGDKPFGKPRTAGQLPFDRFADGQCMGCHTTGYRYERMATPRNALWSMIGNGVSNGVDTNGVLAGATPGSPGTAAEMGIGCESCHGPGSAHNASQSDPGGAMPSSPRPLVAGKIIHPLKHLSPLQQSMQCGQCHSRGLNNIAPGTNAATDRAANPLGFPDVLAKKGDLGFRPGDTDLSTRIRVFGGFGHVNQSFWPNDWAKQSRMQWQDHIRSAHHTANAASCLTCHSGHAPMQGRIDNDRFQLRHSAAVLAGTSKAESQCESCHHDTGAAKQPNKEMFEGSPMHAAGVTCVDCHMPPVAHRIGRTTKTKANADGTFQVTQSQAKDGKHFDVSAHQSRVAPTSEGAEVAPSIGMRSSCESCHGANPVQPAGSHQTDKKLNELLSCRKDFVRDRLDRLREGLAAAELRTGTMLAKARAELAFITVDRSWGAHNWDKTLIRLRVAAEDIAASCGGPANCQVGNLIAINTPECSVRRIAVLPPQIAADRQPAVTALPKAPGVATPSKPLPPAPAGSAAPNVASVAVPPPPQTKTQPMQDPLSVFKDCETCPDMIVAPPGTFSMGSPPSEKGRSAVEGPVRTVTVASAFAAARHAVTVDQYQAFATDTNRQPATSCRAAEGSQWVDKPGVSWRAPGFAQDGSHPVVCVTSADAAAYTAWLSAKTGKGYRLLSEAEREYVARAATTSAYWWGAAFDARMVAHDTRVRPANPATPIAGVSRFQGTVPVQSFMPNPWGFHHVHGNVAEWTSDCWNRSLAGLVADGSPALVGDCTMRALRGGSWSYWPDDMRAAYREPANAEQRYVHVGFRVAQDLATKP